MRLRLIHPRPDGRHPAVTTEEHDRQRNLVELAERLSSRRQERRDESAVMARRYARVSVENVVPIRPRDPDGPRPAA